MNLLFIILRYITCNHPHKVKLAKFWMTLAVSVSVLKVFDSGYACVRPKRDGLRMAGHRKRRKREAEIRRWLISGLPWSSHSSAQLEKILFNSSGKDLEAQRDETSALWFNIFQCLFVSFLREFVFLTHGHRLSFALPPHRFPSSASGCCSNLRQINILGDRPHSSRRRHRDA